MTIFAVLMPIPQPALIDEITKSFPDNYLSLNQKWAAGERFLVGKDRLRRLGRRAKKLLEKRAIIGERGWGWCGPSVLLRQPAAGRGERAMAFQRS